MSDRAGPGLKKWCALLLIQVGSVAGLYLFFVRTAPGQLIDGAAVLGLFGIEVISVLDELLNVEVLLLLGILLTAITASLMRRDQRNLLLALMIVIGANLTAQIMKSILLRPFLVAVGSSMPPLIFPEGRELPSSLPSGHVTFAASVGVAVVIFAPKSIRFACTAAGVVLVLITSIAATQAGWHRPSDALAAVLTVGFWVALGLCVLSSRSATPKVSLKLVTTSAGFLLAGLLIFLVGGIHHDRPAGISSGLPSGIGYGGFVLALLGASCLLMMQVPSGMARQSGRVDQL